jgi:hypothetical protein
MAQDALKRNLANRPTKEELLQSKPTLRALGALTITPLPRRIQRVEVHAVHEVRDSCQ